MKKSSIPKPLIVWAIILMFLGCMKLIEILNFCLDKLKP